MIHKGPWNQLLQSIVIILCTHKIGSSSALTTGEPHSTVQVLTRDNVDQALNDPANGLWLLKFYAPWCSHCKKLAPTLDKMAPRVAGKLAIGKIDCTSSSGKPLCESHQVRGYPTLKIYRDGDYLDYTGKRDADSMIAFAERMSRPAVKFVESKLEFEEAFLLGGGGGGGSGGVESGGGAKVAFLFYDAKASSSSTPKKGVVPPQKTSQQEEHSDEKNLVQEYLTSTASGQVFGQVARKLQHKAHFGMLHPGRREELEQFGLAKSKGPLVAKIESGVDPIVYSGKMNTLDLMDFVKENNAALVTLLERHNFRQLAGMGRPLLIGIIHSSSTNGSNQQQSMQDFLGQIRDYAKNGQHKDQYRFAAMEGIQWGQYLKQFSILTDADHLPQFLVLDTVKRVFYQNETFDNVAEFLQGVQNGTIEMREQSTQTNTSDGPLQKFHDFFIKYMPYLLILLFVIIAGVVCFVLNDNEDEIRYQKMLQAQAERAKKMKDVRKQKPVKED